VTLDVPDDAPRYRFMRYVRPPVDQASTQRDAGSLFPLRPNTRKLRVAVIQALVTLPWGPGVPPVMGRVG
jgi:hypothetical protein